MLSMLASTGRLSGGSFWRTSSEGRRDEEGVLHSERRPDVKSGEYCANMMGEETEKSTTAQEEEAGVVEGDEDGGEGGGGGERASGEAFIIWRRARAVGVLFLQRVVRHVVA